MNRIVIIFRYYISIYFVCAYLIKYTILISLQFSLIYCILKTKTSSKRGILIPAEIFSKILYIKKKKNNVKCVTGQYSTKIIASACLLVILDHSTPKAFAISSILYHAHRKPTPNALKV